MSSKRTLVLIVAIAAFALLATQLEDEHSQPDEQLTATVTRVVDGDTVVVLLDGRKQRLRYIGVDTPETVKPGEPVQCFGKAASTYNRRLVEGRQVRLQIGRERLDRFGRLLAYVYLPGKPETFVNEKLIAGGYGRTLAIAPNTKYVGRFSELQREARRRGAGLWRACG